MENKSQKKDEKEAGKEIKLHKMLEVQLKGQNFAVMTRCQSSTFYGRFERSTTPTL